MGVRAQPPRTAAARLGPIRGTEIAAGQAVSCRGPQARILSGPSPWLRAACLCVISLRVLTCVHISCPHEDPSYQMSAR